MSKINSTTAFWAALGGVGLLAACAQPGAPVAGLDRRFALGPTFNHLIVENFVVRRLVPRKDL